MKTWRSATGRQQILFCVLFCVVPCAAQQNEVALANSGETPKLSDTGKPMPLQPERSLVKEGERVILPEVPAPLEPKKPGFWTFGSWEDDHPLRTNGEILHDKTWRVTQTFWLGAIAYDVELTHQGLAHHKCVENSWEDPHPSRGDLYRGHIAEYAVGSGLNWLFMKYVSKSLTLEFPGYASAKHLQDGSRWLTDCW